MIVRKCNVCGKIYDEPWNKDRTKKVAELTIYSVPVPAKRKVDDEKQRIVLQSKTDEYIDLCPECTGKVEQFIEVLKSGEEYSIYINPVAQE